jgi:hypothetical protein
LHDYALVVKYGDFAQITHLQYHLLFTLMQMPGADTREHTKVLTLHLLVVSWLDISEHSALDVFTSDPRSMNEEIGGVAFSVLARYILSSPSRSELKQVEKEFLMLPVKMTTAQDMRCDLHTTSLTGGNADVTKAHAEDLIAIRVHFKTKFREMSANQWQVYGGNIID